MRVVEGQACASKLLVSSLACKLRRYKRIYRSIISTSRNRELSACQKEKKKKKKCGRWWRCSYFLVEVEIFLSFVADFRGNINVNEIIANSDQNLNMRTLNFLSLCITFFFFKFCRSCFTSLFTTLPTENIRDGIKKQRRNRGCHRLKIICIPLLMPPPSPSSIPRVPSEGWNEQIPRTNGRYGIRGRKTRVRGNGRAVGWIKCRRRGEEETFAIIVIYDRVENEADLVEATALCRICRSSNGSAINILINYWLFILIIEKFTRKIYIYIQAS